jgi:uncharacterized protein involved in exopolysaccharide biosynthesis
MAPSDLDKLHDQEIDDGFPVFNYKRIISELVIKWYWFFICLAIAYTIAWLYNRYTTTVFSMKSSIMIMEEGSTSFWRENRGFTGEALQGFGTSYQGISNQMIILKSKPLIQRALDELGFEVSYFHEGKISIAENYTDAPFKVVWDKTHPQLIGLNFKLVIEPDGRMTLKAKGESARIYTYAAKRWGGTWNNVDYEKELVSGDTIKVPGYFCFVIRLIEGYNYPNIDEYFFNFQTTEDLVNSYRSRLTVSMDNWETSIVDLSLKDFHPQKGVDFLNKLMEVYRIDNVDKKNEYADQTIAFIDYL